MTDYLKTYKQEKNPYRLAQYGLITSGYLLATAVEFTLVYFAVVLNGDAQGIFTILAVVAGIFYIFLMCFGFSDLHDWLRGRASEWEDERISD